MGDESLRIRVELDAATGTAKTNLKDVADALGALKVQAMNGKVGFDALTQEAANLQNQLITLHQQGKITDAQFKQFGTTFTNAAGFGSRAMYEMAAVTSNHALPAVNEFTRIISDAPYGIRGMANNVQQLATLMGTLAAQSGGVVGALKAMGQMMLGPAGIILAINAAVSALVAWANKNEKLKEDVEWLGGEFERMLSIAERVGTLTKADKLASLREALEDAKKKRIAAFEEDDAKEYNRLSKLIDEYEAKIAETERDITKSKDTEEKKRTADLKRELDRRRQDVEDYWDWVNGMSDARGAGGKAKEEGYRARRKGQDLARRKGRSADDLTFEDEKAGLRGFQQAFQSTAQVMSNNVDQYVTKAWQRSFGEANSLLEQFSMNMVSAITDIGAKLATGQIFKWLGMIPGLGFLGGIGGSIFESFGLGRTYAMPPSSSGKRPEKMGLSVDISTTKLSVGVNGGDRIRKRRQYL